MPELNKYLKHHRLEKHLNSTKTDKVQVITRHWLLHLNPEVTDLLQTGLRERDEAENELFLDSDNDDSDEDDNGGSKSSADEENENDYIDSGDRDELRVVILTFINDEEEVERPAITHSGRTTNNIIAIKMPSVLTTSVHSHVTARAAILEMTRRSEIDFCIIDSSTNSEQAGTFLF